jgi:hypothetical protein
MMARRNIHGARVEFFPPFGSQIRRTRRLFPVHGQFTGGACLRVTLENAASKKGALPKYQKQPHAK